MRLLALASILLSVACGGSSKTIVDSDKPGASSPASTSSPARQAVDDLAHLRFERLGNPVVRWDHIAPVKSTKEAPHELLVVLVEFPDRKFDRFKGKKDQGKLLADYYQKDLFDDTYSKKNTLSHYYATQSVGAYHLTGRVVAPVTLSKPRAFYGGTDRPEGGTWRNDANTASLVVEALQLAAKSNANLPWGNFDRFDPEDFDGDNVRDEADGYIDHFVIVFAGGDQASCQRLNKLDEILTPNVGMEALKTLTPPQRECTDRIWPHRFYLQENEGSGPSISGSANPRGGVSLFEKLWVRDYNVQSEYATVSTFAHEFGHSLGLPDVYSRTSSNSTGAWALMSNNADESPQSMSAWSRLQLGWLQPKVVTPPQFGGKAEDTATLQILDDQGKADRAVMVVLPPKERTIELTALPAAGGAHALYSGQGNDMNRSATLTADLSATKDKVRLSFDAWWDIEAGWDFAYVETSTDGGASWQRRLPINRAHMPAKHGHDGKDTLPGFTGVSGDLDGDGKNESNASCDPSKELAHGEDQAGQERSPCLEPSWVHPSFDLSDLSGKKALVRLRYYTDMAAVQRGILIDNVELAGTKTDFEAAAMGAQWALNGFSLSSGRHELLVPHYYVIEYRNPYHGDAHRYDKVLAEPSYFTYWNLDSKSMEVAAIRPRPGVLIWYFDGAFSWSENDPATNGPGKGYLLALDSNPNEYSIPGLERWFKGKSSAFDTHYDIDDSSAQSMLADAFARTACFTRAPAYLPGIDAIDIKMRSKLRCGKQKPALGRLSGDGNTYMYGYQLRNEYLPGPERFAITGVSELYDTKKQKGVLSYRIRDVSLRYAHTLDEAFSAKEFADGTTFYRVAEGDKGSLKLDKIESRPHPGTASFTDKNSSRWQNPSLPFGGVTVPSYGLRVDVSDDGGDTATVRLTWQE